LIHRNKQIITATATGRERITYGEWADRTRRLGGALDALGISATGRVGTFAWNTQRHLELYFAVSGMGAVMHTVNPRLFAEQIRPAIQNLGRRYEVLGTDGFGRSDTREQLRHFFEVDRRWVTVAALKALADDGKIDRSKVAQAISKYQIDPNKPNPMKM